MKKSLVIITLSIFIMYCQKDETPITPTPPDPPIITENELLSITIPDNYYPENASNPISANVYLTDANGEIITSSALSNNNTTVLKADFDYENNKYDATILRKSEFSIITSYYIDTYIDMAPYQLEIKEDPWINHWKRRNSQNFSSKFFTTVSCFNCEQVQCLTKHFFHWLH